MQPATRQKLDRLVVGAVVVFAILNAAAMAFLVWYALNGADRA